MGRAIEIGQREQLLGVGYGNCSPQQPSSDTRLLRGSLWLKRHHPQWGTPLMRLKLLERYGPQLTPSIRTLQRWFRQHHLSKPRQQLAQAQSVRVKPFITSGKWMPKKTSRWGMANQPVI